MAVYGVCGGMQMLGNMIHDPDKVEGGDFPGLGLLDIHTTFFPEKVTQQTEVLKRGRG
ncbi:MAG: hypothetical protein SGI98_03800 [Verrucomicrobiota bacterium]|nr:hypothetical protein [Verrucomicrobiota bacterium]